jgi:phage shock protein C
MRPKHGVSIPVTVAEPGRLLLGLNAEASRPAFGDISQQLGKLRLRGEAQKVGRAPNALKRQERGHLARSVLRGVHEARGSAHRNWSDKMQKFETNVFWGRDDTGLGVCAALGEDFGFNPIYLRIALAFGVYLNPIATIAAYLAAGIVIVATRLLVPNPRVAEARTAEAVEDRPVEAPEEQMELAIAA